MLPVQENVPPRLRLFERVQSNVGIHPFPVEAASRRPIPYSDRVNLCPRLSSHVQGGEGAPSFFVGSASVAYKPSMGSMSLVAIFLALSERSECLENDERVMLLKSS
jgi:hypothetical protein